MDSLSNLNSRRSLSSHSKDLDNSRRRESILGRAGRSLLGTPADGDHSQTIGGGDVTLTRTEDPQGSPSPTQQQGGQGQTQQQTTAGGEVLQQDTTSTTIVPGQTTFTTKTEPFSVSFPTSGAVDTTAQSAIGMVVTSDGKVFTTTPSSFTSLSTFTSDNRVFTVTVNIHNPTGALNKGGSSGSSSNFFNNKGAVAGVFVVVGLAVVAIIAALATIFFRRRRRQRLDREVTAAAVAASAAAARHPLDEEGDISHPPSDSYPSTMSPSTMSHPTMAQYNQYPTTFGNAGGYDPFTGTPAAAGVAGAAAGAAGAGAYAAYHDQPPYSDDAQYMDVEPYTDNQPFSDRGYSDQLGYNNFATSQSPDFSQPAPPDHPLSDDHAGGGGGYEGLHQGGEGYYYDPGYDINAASAADAFVTPPSDIEPPTAHQNPFQDYSGGEGSIDTPMERPDPLHVANPSSPHGDSRL